MTEMCEGMEEKDFKKILIYFMCGYILLEVENTINTATINPAHNSLIFKKRMFSLTKSHS